MSQLRGLVGQSMSGRKRQYDGYVAPFTPGTYAFTPPMAGYWKFVGWGPGGAGATPASGAYFEKTAYLSPARAVAIVVGAGQPTGGLKGSDTTVTLDRGVATAGAADDATAGVASGGDVNLNGSLGGVAGQGTGGGSSSGSSGGGAPANLPFRGGNGGLGGFTGAVVGRTPGGGAGSETTSYGLGGDGMVLAIFVRRE